MSNKENRQHSPYADTHRRLRQLRYLEEALYLVIALSLIPLVWWTAQQQLAQCHDCWSIISHRREKTAFYYVVLVVLPFVLQHYARLSFCLRLITFCSGVWLFGQWWSIAVQVSAHDSAGDFLAVMITGGAVLLIRCWAISWWIILAVVVYFRHSRRALRWWQELLLGIAPLALGFLAAFFIAWLILIS